MIERILSWLVRRVGRAMKRKVEGKMFFFCLVTRNLNDRRSSSPWTNNDSIECWTSYPCNYLFFTLRNSFERHRWKIQSTRFINNEKKNTRLSTCRQFLFHQWLFSLVKTTTRVYSMAHCIKDFTIVFIERERNSKRNP